MQILTTFGAPLWSHTSSFRKKSSFPIVRNSHTSTICNPNFTSDRLRFMCWTENTVAHGSIFSLLMISLYRRNWHFATGVDIKIYMSGHQSLFSHNQCQNPRTISDSRPASHRQHHCMVEGKASTSCFRTSGAPWTLSLELANSLRRFLRQWHLRVLENQVPCHVPSFKTIFIKHASVVDILCNHINQL